ncbi:hypothetical protein C8Q76DRAFT_803946 [Earliella scabrosa]|nr:hypothetical protein C8Q76DRAFT_803946 [Earliella scabrosa]
MSFIIEHERKSASSSGAQMTQVINESGHRDPCDKADNIDNTENINIVNNTDNADKGDDDDNHDDDSEGSNFVLEYDDSLPRRAFDAIIYFLLGDFDYYCVGDDCDCDIREGFIVTVYKFIRRIVLGVIWFVCALLEFIFEDVVMTASGDDLSDIGGDGHDGSPSFLPWVRGIVGVVLLLVKYALATIVVVNLVIVISRNSVISERHAVRLGCLLLPALTSCPPSDAISPTMSTIPNSASTMAEREQPAIHASADAPMFTIVLQPGDRNMATGCPVCYTHWCGDDHVRPEDASVGVVTIVESASEGSADVFRGIIADRRPLLGAINDGVVTEGLTMGEPEHAMVKLERSEED